MPPEWDASCSDGYPTVESWISLESIKCIASFWNPLVAVLLLTHTHVYYAPKRFQKHDNDGEFSSIRSSRVRILKAQKVASKKSR